MNGAQVGHFPAEFFMRIKVHPMLSRRWHQNTESFSAMSEIAKVIFDVNDTKDRDEVVNKLGRIMVKYNVIPDDVKIVLGCFRAYIIDVSRAAQHVFLSSLYKKIIDVYNTIETQIRVRRTQSSPCMLAAHNTRTIIMANTMPPMQSPRPV